MILFVSIALVAFFYVAGGWYFSTMIYESALKAEPYDPSGLQTGHIGRVAVDDRGDARVVLEPDAQFAGQTKFDDSIVGIAVGESLLVVGPVDAEDGARPVQEVHGDMPRRGDRYGLVRDVWLTPEQAGLSADDVTVVTLDDREFPAWRVRVKKSDDWAILTHGRGASRSEMLRMGRILHDAGYNLLVITYTNDPGVPTSDDGMVSYGRHEWADLEGAVEYVLDRNPARIVLGGTSHGGAVTLGFLARSTLALRVDAVILDAPATSLRDVIDEGAEFRTLPVVGTGIPESLEDTALLMASVRYGVSYGPVDYAAMPDLIEVPLLTFQGAQDRTIAREVNDRFMRAGSGQGGTYVVEDGADHLLSWNQDPDAYKRRIKRFLRGLDD